MPTNFPSGIDTFVNPTAGDALTFPPHASQHANSNDAMSAVQTTLGVNPQGGSATVGARITLVESALTGAAGGDLVGTYPDPTLADVLAVDAGTFGSSSQSVALTVDAKGRITNVSEQTIVMSGAAGGDLVGTYPNPTLAEVLVDPPGTYGSATESVRVTLDAKGRVTGVTTEAIAAGGAPDDGAYLLWDSPAPGTRTNAKLIADSSEIEAVDVGADVGFALLATTVVPNTYGNSTTIPQITVDSKGRITSVVDIPAAGGGGGGGGNADNINGGLPGNLLYQFASSDTMFVTNGTLGQVLLSAGSAMPTWNNQSALSVGTAVSLFDGTAGAVPYQSASGVTAFATGTSGQVLKSNGVAAPAFVDQSTLSVGSATNLAGGAAGRVAYQSGVGATSFAAVGVSGQFLKSNATAAPSWIDLSVDLASATVTGVLAPEHGGTGVNNLGKNITLGGSLTTAGGSLSLTLAGATAVTLPLSGTLVPTTGTGATGTWGIGISGNAATATLATRATNIAAGLNKQIPIQTGVGTTSFVAAPTSTGQVLTASGVSPFTVDWAAPVGVTGTGAFPKLAMWSGSSSLASATPAAAVLANASTSWGWSEEFVSDETGGPWMDVTRVGKAEVVFDTTRFGNGHQGIYRCRTFDVTSTPDDSIAVASPSLNALCLSTLSSAAISFENLILIDEKSDATNGYTVRCGFGDLTTAVFTNGVYVQYDSTVSPNWFFVCANLGARTLVDTGVTVQADTWYNMFISCYESQATLIINNGSNIDISTRLPTGRFGTVGLQYVRTVGAVAAARDVYIDYVAVKQDGLTRP